VAAARLLLAATRRRPTARYRLLHLLRHGARPASPAEVTRAYRAIVAVSLPCASGHGCLPRSLAIVLWCRAAGQHAIWVLGTATSPATAHAWVEAAGRPVAEPVDPHLLYQTVISI
jgi:hypothetical protein